MTKIILLILFTIFGNSVYAQTVPNASPLYNSYSCNGSTTQFPYLFYINSTSDMVLQLMDNLGNITYPTNFSVDTTNIWVNYPLTGTSCPSGYTVTLYASTPITQTTTYGNRTPFTAITVGSSLNKLTIIDQQLQRQLNTALLLPVGQSPGLFPSSNPGYLIGWNGSGVLANINNPSAVAQWGLTGANIYYNLGLVGIGNTNPGQELDVTGTVRSTSFIETGSVANSFSGNVGIGSITPGVSLDVQGTVRTIGFSMGGNTTTAITGTGANVFAVSPAFTGTVTASSLTTTGNVGINSANPGQFLDVQGTVRAISFTGQNGSGLLGSWSTFTCETTSHAHTYQATTDLFIAVNNSMGSTSAECITDSNSSPTTVRSEVYLGAASTNVGCTTVVKKGDYYEGLVGGSAGCYQISIGS